jgi:hypothetical protein
VHGLENQEDLELHAHDLVEINNDSFWMDKFDSVDEKVSSKLIINCTEIEHYDIGCEFHVKHNVHYQSFCAQLKKKMN